jgi:H+/Cl- antiporter ClcA
MQNFSVYDFIDHAFVHFLMGAGFCAGLIIAGLLVGKFIALMLGRS